MAKKIILCADDFGQEPHISHGVLTLAKERRISAISCMTTGEDWVLHGPKLRDFEGHVDRGLHFNLTHGEGKNFQSLMYWITRSLTRQIDRKFIEKRLIEQLDHFTDVLGTPPDFIDGHQHVHTFPIIRDVLIEVVKKRFCRHLPYVRVINPMLGGAGSKMKVLASQVLSFGFSHILDKQGIDHNSTFGGMYDLCAKGQYRQFMIHWLRQACPGTLIMCHPGISPRHSTNDPHPATRVEEYTYLLSDYFQEDCLQAGVTLGRFSHNAC